MTDALVIGAGPAGLMAAEMLADAGHSVCVTDAKPSVGRKFLMAGKSGLNLTKDEPFDTFLGAFGTASDWLKPSLQSFTNADVIRWANDLGQDTFTGSTKRVFPKSMKASPLLRKWLARLSDKGVQFETKWRWVGWEDDTFTFATTTGHQHITPSATVLALGGASWSKLGSDGAWATLFAQRGIETAPFEPANMGLIVPWSEFMKPHFGQPLKNVAITAGDVTKRGECVISSSGLEGSLIYQFSKPVRQHKPMSLDLIPDQTAQTIQAKINKQPAKASRTTLLRKALNLPATQTALMMEFARTTPRDGLAAALKALPIPYTGTAALDQAISVAGGVRQSDLTDDFMLLAAQGAFCAGEMLDWEAPTGGYLITACLATGRAAGQAAAKHISQQTE